MTWFKLDDQFHSHPKVITAGNAAIGLYCRLGTYCADKLTDGFIAKPIAMSMGSKAELRALTVCPIPDTRPLLAVVDGGYHMVDYLQYNPTREQVLAERGKAKARMDKLRGRSGVGSGEQTANEHTNFAPGSPSPVPVPVPPEYISDNSTSVNTPPPVDNSRIGPILAEYARLALAQAKLQGRAISDDDAYCRGSITKAKRNPNLARWTVMFPDAPASAVAAWLMGDKHSMGYYTRAAEDGPMATVHHLPGQAS